MKGCVLVDFEDVLRKHIVCMNACGDSFFSFPFSFFFAIFSLSFTLHSFINRKSVTFFFQHHFVSFSSSLLTKVIFLRQARYSFRSLPKHTLWGLLGG